MKKIFVIEINEKDKNIDNYEAVMALDKDFQEFSDKLRNNDNIYVQLKRSGSIWRNILDNIQEKFNNKSDNDSNDDSNDNKNRKINNLKIIK